MPRNLPLLLALLICLSGVIPAAAQTPTAAEERAAVAVTQKIARLEAKGLYDVLYGDLHPDAAALVAEPVVVARYEELHANTLVGEATVTEISFEEWVWPVTGLRYPQTAVVSFVKPVVRDGVPAEERGVLHLVQDDDGWGWFFGDSQSWIDQQVARYEAIRLQDPNAPSRFQNRRDADIDRFWARAFAAAGREYLPPDQVVGFDDLMLTDCGATAPPVPEAFYCGIDETIYYVANFRDGIAGDVGGFAWGTVVAHEWGHHIQDHLGLRGSLHPERSSRLSYKEMELQADCLAGAYAADAAARGAITPVDLNQALSLTDWAGDPPETPIDEITAHGSGEERVAAFETGYPGGIAARGIDLAADADAVG